MNKHDEVASVLIQAGANLSLQAEVSYPRVFAVLSVFALFFHCSCSICATHTRT